jgi:hypothetical protein
MKELSTNYINQYYYIDSNVIFDIKEYNDGRTCVKSAKSLKDDLPVIKVNNIYTYYLDTFIEDGDEYYASGDNKGFKKVDHTKESHPKSSFTDYYKNLCIESIKEGIKDNFSYDLDWFKEHTFVLSVPKFMIKENGYAVVPDIAISLTDNFDKFKKEIVWEDVVKSAKSITKNYSTTEWEYDAVFTPAANQDPSKLELTKDGTKF